MTDILSSNYALSVNGETAEQNFMYMGDDEGNEFIYTISKPTKNIDLGFDFTTNIHISSIDINFIDRTNQFSDIIYITPSQELDSEVILNLNFDDFTYTLYKDDIEINTGSFTGNIYSPNLTLFVNFN